MTLTMADSTRYIRDLFANETPTLLSWPICTSMELMLINTPLETNARTLITTKYRRALPPRWERVGTKPPARLQLLRKDPCVIKRFGISRKIRRYIRAKTHYSIVDMEDIRYTIRQGRYSDKQTSKRSFPIPALV